MEKQYLYVVPTGLGRREHVWATSAAEARRIAAAWAEQRAEQPQETRERQTGAIYPVAL